MNKFGQRFKNEDITTQAACTGKAIQPDNIAWSVFDEYLEMLKPWRSGRAVLGPGQPVLGPALQPRDGTRHDQWRIENGNIVTADTIEELAEKMGVPADNLKPRLIL